MRDHSVGEGFPQLFQPDTLLPSQYYAALRRRSTQEPERRLVVALLQDAIECYQKHLFARDHKARQLFVDAEEWILSNDRSYFFAFENVCELLSIHPEFMRQGLINWRERTLAQGRGKVLALAARPEAQAVDATPFRKVAR